MTEHGITIGAEALIFDLDGTLIDSSASLQRAWTRWATEHGIGPDEFAAAAAHGLTSAAVVAALVPPERFDAAFRRIDNLESTDVGDVTAMPGAKALLSRTPPDRVAIATSGTRAVAMARLRAAGLDAPGVVVTADDVRRGKPDPEPFLLTASLLGVRPADCAVIEDAPAGLTAARVAGMRAIVLTTTTPREKFLGGGLPAGVEEPDLIVEGLHRLALEIGDGSLTIHAT